MSKEIFKTELDLKAFNSAWEKSGRFGAKDWATAIIMFKAALAHRDEQVKGLVEALEEAVEVFEAIPALIQTCPDVHAQIIETKEKALAALEAVKGTEL